MALRGVAPEKFGAFFTKALTMKLERRIGNKSVYLDCIDGREVRATTTNGPVGAEKIFAIMRSQKGVAKSPAIRQDLAPTPRRRLAMWRIDTTNRVSR
jgi:hypothetical protein